MSCLSQFFILTQRGNPIIRKEFRGDLSPATADTFYHNLNSLKTNGGRHMRQSAPPIFLIDGITYFYIESNGLYFVGTTKQCISPSLTMEVLTQIKTVFSDYIGSLNEESIKQNFILLYELLDEILDFGYAQSISTELLKEFVFNEPPKIKKSKNISQLLSSHKQKQKKTQNCEASQRPVWSGNALPKQQRRKGNKNKNEIFVDILERVSVTFNTGSNGTHLSNAIDGSIKMKSYLTGNPPLIMCLNRDLFVTDINFNEIVNLERYECEKVLHFIPPSGEFNILNYRLTNDFESPFQMFPVFRLVSPYKSELVLKLRSDGLAKTYFAKKVCVEIPIFMDCQTVSTRLGTNVCGQTAEFDRKNGKIRWKIEKFSGESEHSLEVTMTFKERKTMAIQKQIGPISMVFEIPNYNVSNLRIQYLRVMEAMPKFKPYKWVRYVTQSQSYICRL